MGVKPALSTYFTYAEFCDLPGVSDFLPVLFVEIAIIIFFI
jgi:hypothetical protein